MAGKRKIFEDVSADAGSSPAQPQPQPGMLSQGDAKGRGLVRAWLFVLGLMVVAMILVGGLTRLTDSGLSITEWKPITGALPPLSAEAWDGEFAKYQEIPEFELQNQDMTLEEFKTIYWWEWGHRQLGRVIGLVWAAGFAGFYFTKQIPNGWTGRLLTLGGLGALQGAIGWWMVSSGLSGRMVDVASYRLAVHLGLAFAILGCIAWYIMLLSREARDLMTARRAREAKLSGMSTGLMHFAMLQILLGALVAGIDAGRNFPEWPLMAGGIFPPDIFALSPWWSNFFENAGLVQFIHRLSAYLLLGFGVAIWMKARKSGNGAIRTAFHLAGGLLVLQVIIGIGTVVHAAPLHWAVIHQFTAILLWVSIVNARFNAFYPIAQSVRN
ncbi:MAG: heme A synthase [Mangrovicoccus sp.]